MGHSLFTIKFNNSEKFTLITLIVCTTVFEGNSQDHNHAIIINPLSLIVATENVQAEKALSPTTSAQLGLALSGYKISGTKYSFFQVTPEFRKYFGEDNLMNGVYIGPYVRVRSGKYGIFGSDVKYTTFGGGVVIGYQHISSGGFVYDIYAGPNYGSKKYKFDGAGEDADSKGTGNDFGLRFGLSIGFAK